MSHPSVPPAERASSPLALVEPARIGEVRHYTVGLRSGASHVIASVDTREVDDAHGGTDLLVTAFRADGEGKSCTEIRFLASDIEYVSRAGHDGISPQRAAKLHSQLTTRLVDEVMTPEHEDLMERFRELAAHCIDERPSWFVEAVTRNLEVYESGDHRPSDYDEAGMRALLTDDRDAHEMTQAVLLLIVHACYEALAETYRGFILQDEWLKAAMDHLPVHLASDPL